jgi:hypothetical protein
MLTGGLEKHTMIVIKTLAGAHDEEFDESNITDWST